MSKKRDEGVGYPRIDETTNVLVQLFNILLEGVAKDREKLRKDVAEAYNSLISVLSLYVDFRCLDPYTRYLLESNLMGDIILSHLEAEEEGGSSSNWLKLSGRTRALIAIAIARCGKGSKISPEKAIIGPGMRVESL